MRYYSATNGGMYDTAFHDYALPVDAVEISDEAYHGLMTSGKSIVPDANGFPVAIDPPAPTRDIQAEIDQLERESMTNRGARELQLELMRERGAGMGLQSDEAIAAKVPYFAKLLALDVQIRALRAQL